MHANYVMISYAEHWKLTIFINHIINQNKTFMTFKKLLTLAAAIMMAGSISAQEDVTSTYLTNADFSSTTPIDNHLCGYGKDMGSPA